jgi:hypothetical protein
MQLYVGHGSLQCHGPLNWAWLKLEIKHTYWCIPKKSFILNQFKSDVQTQGHKFRYVADTNADADVDATEIEECTQKWHATDWLLLLPLRWGNKILFRIKFPREGKGGVGEKIKITYKREGLSE